MALNLRYNTIAKGDIIMTGNTLGLAGNLVVPAPLPAGQPAGAAAVDTIGAFITQLPITAPGGWPVGTTLNYLQNGSAAQVNIPIGSTVLYAELIWSGTAVNADNTVLANLGDPIKLTNPAGTFNINPDPATASSFIAPGSGNTYYVNSQDVTAEVTAGGAGTYITSEVPGVLGNSVNNAAPNNVTPQNYLGWTLIIAFANASFPLREMDVWVNDTVISSLNPTQNITISGFTTPPIGPVGGRLYLSSGEGDANIVGDGVRFGPTVGTVVTIGNPVTTPNPNPGTTPNNPINNFFGSQVNGDNGLLDTSGSFGTSNQNSFTGTNFAAARQGWDIAAVDVTAQLTNNQTTAAIQLFTVGDAYVNNGIALEIEVFSADLAIVKTASPSPVTVGQTLTYTLTVTNNGPTSALAVVAADAVPATILNPQYSVDGGLTWNNWTGSYPIGGMNVGDVVQILIRGTVDPLATGQVVNIATVSSPTPDPNPNNNSSTNTTDIDESADISVIKSDSPDPVIAGNTLTYSMFVANAGPSIAQTVVLSDAVPASVLNPQYSIDGGLNWLNWTGSLPLGNMNPGANQTVLIRGQVDPAFTGVITNTATVASPTPDPNPNNNSSTVTTQANASADISVFKFDAPDPVIAGQILTYTLAISNVGPSTSKSVIFTDAMPPQLLNPEYSIDGGLNWLTWTGTLAIGDIPPGVGQTLLLRGTVDPSFTGIITNTATVASPTPDPDLSNNTSTVTTLVEASADISIVKTHSPDPVVAGNTLTYTLNVANAGPSTSQTVTLTDAVPASVLSPQYSVDGGLNWLTWTGALPLGNMLPGANQSILIRGQVDPSQVGSINNTATVSSPTPDPNLTNNTSTATTQVLTSADISVIKTDAPDPVIAGNTLTYTLAIANAGPSTSQSVVLTDAIPISVLSPQYSTDGGLTWFTWIGSLSIGNMLPGASSSVLIRGQVNPSQLTPISNTATVASPTPDPNLNNNTSSVSTQVNASADISITKTDAPDPVVAGNLLVYTLAIANAGPSVAQTVTLADAVPASILSPQYSLDGGLNWLTWTGTLPLGNLNPGASQTVLIRGQVDPTTTTQITNTATVTSPTPDPDPTNNSSTAITQVDESADMSIVKTDSPDPVLAGNILTYSFAIANAGPSTAQSVVFTDAIPPQVLSPQYSLDGGLNWNTWTGTLSLGNYASGASQTILIRGQVDPNFAGIITNTATVSSPTPDPNLLNNTSTALTQVNASADISVVKTDSPDPVIAGNTLTYTLAVANAGPSTSQTVTLTDAIPAAVLSPQYSIDGGVNWLNWTGSLSLGNMLPGASQNILIRGQVDPSQTVAITNTATVASPTPDPDLTNNTSTAVTQVNESADISVVKTDSPDPVVAGNVLTYTLAIANAGPSTAQTVTLADAVPAAVLNPQYSTDGGITWAVWLGTLPLGNMLPGASQTVLIRGQVDPTRTTPITNTATVSSPTPDPVPDNNTSTATTQVDSSADISVIKTGLPNPVIAGNVLTYTLAVANAGPSVALNVNLTDAIPGVVLNPQYSTDGGLNWNNWTGILPLGNMAPGASQNVLIRGTVSDSATGQITNTATVSSPTPDPDPTNNTSTAVTQISTSADISVVKTDSPDPVIAGNTLTYTLVVANAGPSVAKTVTMFDVVPPEVLNPQISTDGGLTWNPWINSLSLGDMLPGDLFNILIRGSIDPAATGLITNTATVTSPTPDPNPDNNTSTATTFIDASADISVVKTDSPDPVLAGNILTYTLAIANAGPSVATSVTLTDAIPAVLLSPQYSLDGGTTWSIWNGSLLIGDMQPLASLTVLIRGKVSSAAVGQITNSAIVSSPTPDPNPNNNSSTAITQVTVLADVSVVKTASPLYATIGDEVIYTIIVNNNGPSDAQSVSLLDIIPADIENHEFSLDGGVTWNTWSGNYLVGNMVAGTSVKVLIRGVVAATTKGGKVVNTATVTSPTPDPVPENNTSSATINVIIGKLDLVKTVDKTAAKVGDTLVYTVLVTNTGNTIANNVMFTDPIPANTDFIPGSVTIDGVPELTANPAAGINLGSIGVGETVSVSYSVKIKSLPTPPPAIITNTASVTFEYTVDPTKDPLTSQATSNQVVTTVGIVDLEVVKTADTDLAIEGKNVTYTITVTNKGTVPLNNVFFSDNIQENTTFVPNSVVINGVVQPGLNPQTGFTLGTINPGETVTINFTVTLDFVGCSPRIANQAVINYEYTLGAGQPVQSGSQTSNLLVILVAPTTFKQLSRDENLTIPIQKPDIEDLLNTMAEIEITQTKVIKTIAGTSNEGQILSGYKLIIEGVLNQKVEYIAADIEQSVHAAHFRVPFSTYIILKKDYTEGTEIKVEAEIEDIYTKIINPRTIFKNVTFRLIAVTIR